MTILVHRSTTMITVRLNGLHVLIILLNPKRDRTRKATALLSRLNGAIRVRLKRKGNHLWPLSRGVVRAKGDLSSGQEMCMTALKRLHKSKET